MTALVIILLIILIIVGFEDLEMFLTWVERFKIGRLTESEWKDKARSALLKWIRKGTPEVSTNDNTRTNFIKKVNSYGKITSITYWQDASLLKALNVMQGDHKNEVDILVNRYIPFEDGEWRVMPKKVDSAMLCSEILLSKYIDNEKVKPAMTYVAEMLKTSAENYGTVPYNMDVPQYRFVDTIGMICPFLFRYAITYGEKEYIDIAMKQIKEYRENGVNEKFKIPFHCFKTGTLEPLGVCGWGRGCAWWATGLVDSLKALLECDGYNKEKAELLKLSLEILEAVKKYVHEDGTVDRMIFINSIQDSSACAMLAYCYAYIADLTGSDEYKSLAVKMREKLRTVTRRNGVVDFSQGDTHGIGFYSEKVSVVPATQGFAIVLDELLD